MEATYDIIILGGGPAGLSAGIYSGRARLKTLILEKGSVGGRASTTEEIVNYPGFIRITGPELAERMREQAAGFGVEFRTEQVKGMQLEGPWKELYTRRNTYRARAVILAGGTDPKIIGIPGERELVGQGVAYCATCDAEFFQDQDVAVIGSGDQAVEESMFIARYARRVFVVVRRREGELRCNRASAEKAMKNERLQFLWNSEPVAVLGEDEVSGLELRDTQTGEKRTLACQGVFFFVGTAPNTDIIPSVVQRNGQGFLLANDDMETNIAGVYAAGDIREKRLRQVCTAVNDGAVAATAAVAYLDTIQ